MVYKGRSPNRGGCGLITSNWLPFVVQNTAVSVGLARSSTSSGTNSYRNTGVIGLFTPFILTAIKWNLHATGDYDISIVADRETGYPTVLYALNPAYSADGGTGEDTIPISAPIILLPGKHYIGALYSGGAEHINYNSNSLPCEPTSECDYLVFCGSWTTAKSSNNVAMRLVGYPINIDILKNLEISPI